jgi:hypothetical protein
VASKKNLSSEFFDLDIENALGRGRGTPLAKFLSSLYSFVNSNKKVRELVV